MKHTKISIELFFLFLFVIIAYKSNGQQEHVKLIYNQASALFEHGHLEEIDSLFKRYPINTLIGTKEETVKAYELLTTTYLYLKDEEGADNTFWELLTVNPIYTTNKTTDQELVAFAKFFRSTPNITVGLITGVNYTNAISFQFLGTGDGFIDGEEGEDEEERDDYNYRFGAKMGTQANIHLTQQLEFSTGFVVAIKSFEYHDVLEVYSPLNERVNHASGEVTHFKYSLEERHTYWQVPLSLRFTFGTLENQFYLGGGSTFHFFRNGLIHNINPSKNVNLDKIRINPRSSDAGVINTREKWNFSLLANAGFRKRVGQDYVFLEAGYNRMARNAVNTKNRYQDEDLVFVLGHVDDNFFLHNWYLSIGFLKTFYKIRKY